MFIPANRTDMRRYFCEVYAKWRNGEQLEPIEKLLSAWMHEHPEYNAVLSQPEASAGSVAHPDHADNANPFLHLSMHLALSEQSGINKPEGIQQAIDSLALRMGSLHQAHHAVMECLTQMLATSQATGKPLDGEAYLACIRAKGNST